MLKPDTLERVAAAKRARLWARFKAVLLGLGICALVLYEFVSYGHGTQKCRNCGVEREAR